MLFLKFKSKQKSERELETDNDKKQHSTSYALSINNFERKVQREQMILQNSKDSTF